MGKRMVGRLASGGGSQRVEGAGPKLWYDHIECILADSFWITFLGCKYFHRPRCKLPQADTWEWVGWWNTMPIGQSGIVGQRTLTQCVSQSRALCSLASKFRTQPKTMMSFWSVLHQCRFPHRQNKGVGRIQRLKTSQMNAHLVRRNPGHRPNAEFRWKSVSLVVFWPAACPAKMHPGTLFQHFTVVSERQPVAI